jgi:tetratricopeptide (TPR) repeat protein
MELVNTARQLSAAGNHVEAIALFEQALDMVSAAVDRAHLLAQLSSEYRMDGRIEDAVTTAAEASELAREVADEAAEAHAGISLASAFLVKFYSEGSETYLFDAIELLDHAASTYERLGRIDFSTALLTMAEAFLCLDDLDVAEGLYARMTRDLVDPRWAKPESLARHADYLRGRAFYGLASIALRRDQRAQAIEYLEAAANLFLAGEPQTSMPCLDQIADVIESELGDGEAAKDIRDAARQMFSGILD